MTVLFELLGHDLRDGDFPISFWHRWYCRCGFVAYVDAEIPESFVQAWHDESCG